MQFLNCYKDLCRKLSTPLLMCNQCVKHPFPDRGTVCLDNGSYYMNFLGCIECQSKDTLQINNRNEEEEEDGEELVTYQHICKHCSHVVANHEHRFKIEDGYQVYEMECLLCGTSEDSRSILPVDPRQQQIFF